jgi:hypothetical protein
MIRGSCLCGSVRYEIRGALARATNCHCSQCRKAHGAAFGTYARVNWVDFTLIAGEAEIGSYQSSPGVRRTFCKTVRLHPAIHPRVEAREFLFHSSSLSGSVQQRPR